MTISIKFDTDLICNYTDEHLAALWHVAQANPAPHGDPIAGQIVEKLGDEIIRRWLSKSAPELHGHKPRDHYWEQLRRIATYVPPAGVDSADPEWLRGSWVVKTDGDGQ